MQLIECGNNKDYIKIFRSHDEGVEKSPLWDLMLSMYLYT